MFNTIKISLARWVSLGALLLICSVSVSKPIKGRLAIKAAPISITIDEEEVTWDAKPSKKEAIYGANERIVYNVEVKNGLKENQEGTLSCLISTFDDKEVGRSSINVNIGKKSTKRFDLKLPGQEAGFYKVNVMINVTEYDDTIRRVVGIDPKQIKSGHAKPADFDAFWESTKQELAKVAPHFKMTEQPNLEKDNTSVYLIEGKSLGNITVRGWLTIKKNRKPNEKFPVWLVVPGYGGVGVKPIFGSTELAVLSFNVRGQGNSSDVVRTTKVGYLTTDIESRNRYVYRGAIMDCIRAMDFVCSRPELDSNNVIISGGSMGGYLAIAAASLDSRIKLCSANNPVFCDYRALAGNKDWPMSDFVKYSKAHRLPMEKIFATLDYFDLKNFSYNLKCQSLIGISLLDNLAPPANEYAMLNNIESKKYKLFVYPELAHEVPPSLFTYLSNWMMDQFGIF
ncbi:acetylxylan esterase [Mucilaginibacter sp. PAMB04168]|uniref:acetylxylan esterase n=1 Tax=Mucilaginibacter sp. PAMB04168 TaxID=3138567 RepID=UPI0031F6E3AE